LRLLRIIRPKNLDHQRADVGAVWHQDRGSIRGGIAHGVLLIDDASFHAIQRNIFQIERQLDNLVELEAGANAAAQLIPKRGCLNDELRQHIQFQDFVPDGVDDSLLPLGAAEVAVAVPGARILEGGSPIHLMDTRGDIERIVPVVHIREQRIVDGIRDIQFNAANRINQRHKSIEIDRYVIVDPNTQIVLDGLHEQLRAGAGLADFPQYHWRISPNTIGVLTRCGSL